MTFDVCFEEFMEIKEVFFSEHTSTSKRSSYKKHIRPVIGAMHVTEIKFPILQNLLNTMIKNGYSPKTVSHVRDIIRTVYNYAEQMEYITKNVARLLEVRRIDNRRFLELTDDEIASFIRSVKSESNPFWRSFFLLMLHGRRLNEVKSLQWSWIDIKRKTVTIPALHSKDRYSHTYGVTDEYLGSLKNLECTSSYVYPSPVTNDKLQDVRKAFTRIRNRAGIKKGKFRIHDIRHLVGTVAVRSGMSLEDVRDTLGHRSLQTSMRYVTAGVEKSSRVSLFISCIGSADGR